MVYIYLRYLGRSKVAEMVWVELNKWNIWTLRKTKYSGEQTGWVGIDYYVVESTSPVIWNKS